MNYKGLLIINLREDWPAVVGNLIRYRKSWARMMRILGREGKYPRIYRIFFKSIFQAVLILGSETWVLTPLI